MRLLRIQDDGGFSLVEILGTNIPPYAILSHTWSTHYEEEVTFKDLIDGTGKSKAGYNKLTFCGTQATKSKLNHFWVDTCCIDKSSSAELSEAINSMFRWYRNAAECYVYLSDVSIGSAAGNDDSQQTWKRDFRHSRWFTRGWTLQELLAPTSVQFFSQEGELLSEKDSIVQDISEITGISAQALQGIPLPRFTIEERISWTAGRKTTREEDAAYSLLGIFDIHIPLLYGEGGKKAFIRLHKEIDESLRKPAKVETAGEKLSKIERLILAQKEEHMAREAAAFAARAAEKAEADSMRAKDAAEKKAAAKTAALLLEAAKRAREEAEATAEKEAVAVANEARKQLKRAEVEARGARKAEESLSIAIEELNKIREELKKATEELEAARLKLSNPPQLLPAFKHAISRKFGLRHLRKSGRKREN